MGAFTGKTDKGIYKLDSIPTVLGIRGAFSIFVPSLLKQ